MFWVCLDIFEVQFNHSYFLFNHSHIYMGDHRLKFSIQLRILIITKAFKMSQCHTKAESDISFTAVIG